MNKTFLTIFLALAFCATFEQKQAVAAFGDCISWIWGGKNETTTYSPPFSPADATMNFDSNQNGGQILGQSTGPATAASATSPANADVCPTEYYPSSSYSAMKPTLPTTELVPVVKKEWTYSPITSVNYKPVQQMDPQSGQVSTYYRAEESKTLLPWLHRKETIEYKPVLAPPKPLSTLPKTTGSQIVQANYAGSQTFVPATQATYSPVLPYDPCNPCGIRVLPSSESIPVQTTGDVILSQSPNASSTASTFVARNTGVQDINYGTPPIREGYEPNNYRAYSQDGLRQDGLGRTPASAANYVPMLDRQTQKPNLTSILISEADMRPAEPFSETAKKPEAATKSSNMIKTPVPELPTVQSSATEKPKLVSPTQFHLKYQQ